MTTKDIYDALVCMPDLHSAPILADGLLIWKLYQDAYIQAYCQDGDSCIDIVSNSLFLGSLMHWHPSEEKMVEKLYALGKKGNLLVLKKTLFGTDIFFVGAPKDFPLAQRDLLHLGKKWGDGGQLIYFEQK